MAPDEIIKVMEKENAKWPEILVQVPFSQWPATRPASLREVWRSRGFLVQIFQENDVKRLSVCRTTSKKDGKWAEEITWIELQNLKAQCGYSDKAAVEIYPPDKDVVNVANMRHLWILDIPPHYMWSEK